jgi:hypothetical protein
VNVKGGGPYTNARLASAQLVALKKQYPSKIPPKFVVKQIKVDFRKFDVMHTKKFREIFSMLQVYAKKISTTQEVPPPMLCCRAQYMLTWHP